MVVEGDSRLNKIIDKIFNKFDKSNVDNKKGKEFIQPEWLELGKFLEGKKLKIGEEIQVNVRGKQIKFILTEDREFWINLVNQNNIKEIKIDDNVFEVEFFINHLLFKIKNNNTKKQVIVVDGEQIDLMDIFDELIGEIYYKDLFYMLNDMSDVGSDEN